MSKVSDKISEWGRESIDLNNLDQMAEDVWLFLTNDKLPEKATIKKEAFLHEVKAMIESARQYYAQRQSIAFLNFKVHEYKC